MSLIHIDMLVKWIGYAPGQEKRAMSWLRKNRIPYYLGKDEQPCTTLEAINSKLVGGIETNNNDDSIEF